MRAAATGTLSTAERSYPTSEVRGRSREGSMLEGQRPRGVTPRPRSGAAAECQAATARERPRGATPHPRPGAAGRSHPAPKARDGCREELPNVRGQEGWRPKEATPLLRSRVAARRSNQGAVAALAQEGLEETILT